MWINKIAKINVIIWEKCCLNLSVHAPDCLKVCLKKKQVSLNQCENEKYLLIKGDNNYSNAKDNNEYFVLGWTCTNNTDSDVKNLRP